MIYAQMFPYFCSSSSSSNKTHSHTLGECEHHRIGAQIGKEEKAEEYEDEDEEENTRKKINTAREVIDSRANGNTLSKLYTHTNRVHTK